MAVAFLRWKRQEGDSELNYNLCHPNTRERGHLLLAELRKLYEKFSLDDCQDSRQMQYEHFIPALAAHYDVSVVVIFVIECILHVNIEYRFPADKLPSDKPIVYLLRRGEEYEGGHIEVITSIGELEEIVGSICVFCNKVLASVPSKYTHICLEREICSSCNRPVQLENTYIDRSKPDEYCNGILFTADDSDDKLDQLEFCKVCDFPLMSPSCRLRHLKICRTKATCPLCGTSLHGSEGADKLMEQHVCGFKHCKTCKELAYSTSIENHICKVELAQWQANWPKCAFLTLHISKCDDLCTVCNEANACELHQSEELPRPEITHIVCHRERVRRCSFQKEIFSSFENVPEIGNFVEHEEYLPADLQFMTNEGLYQSPIKDAPLRKEKAFEQLLESIAYDDTWKNTIIIIRSYREMSYILSSLLLAQITPKAIKIGNKIILLCISTLSLRFLCAEAYSMEPPYAKMVFPKFLDIESCQNATEFATKNLHLHHFIAFGDRPEAVQRAEAFLEMAQQTSTVDLVKLAADVTLENNILLMKECCNFMLKWFQFQLNLQHFTNVEIEPDKMPAIHPFKSPITSLPSFIYHVWQVHTPLAKELRVVRNETKGIYTKTSEAELAYLAQFRLFRGSLIGIKSAFSPYGQKYISQTAARPDIYVEDEKKAIFVSKICCFHLQL